VNSFLKIFDLLNDSKIWLKLVFNLSPSKATGSGYKKYAKQQDGKCNPGNLSPAFDQLAGVPARIDHQHRIGTVGIED